MERGDFVKKVTLIAPVLTQSGYGVHSRQIAKWLLSRKNIDLKIIPVPWGETPWLLNRDSHDGLIGKMMEKTTPLENSKGSDVTIQLQLPNEWNPTLGKINIGITAGIETDKCNPEWIEACNKMSSIVVPTQHVKDTFFRSGNVTTPIHVVPESYPDALKNQNPKQLNLNLTTENNFLIVSQLTGSNPFSDRKNTFFTIKWLCEVFADRPDVGIILKTNLGRNTAIDRKAVTNLMKQLLNEVRKNNSNPKFHLLHGAMTDEELNSLYRHPKIKALISLTRGEGFGLPLLEASVTGLPAITTNWSGHLDFMNKGRFISVDYKLEQIHSSRVDGKLFIEGSRWAQVQEEDFKKKVRKFVDSQTLPREWAQELSAKLTQEYSQSAIESYLNSAIGEYL